MDGTSPTAVACEAAPVEPSLKADQDQGRVGIHAPVLSEIFVVDVVNVVANVVANVNEEVARLAALGAIEYDQERKKAAKQMNCTVGALDKEVSALRREKREGPPSSDSNSEPSSTDDGVPPHWLSVPRRRRAALGFHNNWL